MSFFSYFNSIKVRLKQTINNSSGEFIIFQFHKGTIKTYAGMILKKNLGYFNSIKVRLKHACLALAQMQLAYFNSIKVRLKPKGCANKPSRKAISIP